MLDKVLRLAALTGAGVEFQEAALEGWEERDLAVGLWAVSQLRDEAGREALAAAARPQLPGFSPRALTLFAWSGAAGTAVADVLDAEEVYFLFDFRSSARISR